MTAVIEALEWNINRAGRGRGARGGRLTSVFIQGGRMMDGPTSGRDVRTSAVPFVYLSTLISMRYKKYLLVSLADCFFES